MDSQTELFNTEAPPPDWYLLPRALPPSATDRCLPPSFLLPFVQYTEDEERIVADSCEVALDMLEFELAGGFQYADTGEATITPQPAATAVN